jgi:hypothetical protein
MLSLSLRLMKLALRPQDLRARSAEPGPEQYRRTATAAPAGRSLRPPLAGVAAVTLAAGALLALAAWYAGWPRMASPAASGPGQTSRPAVSLADGRITLETEMTVASAMVLRGWFFLSRPGEPEPWQNFDYKSGVIETVMAAGEPRTFAWSEPLNVPDADYELSIWFHTFNGERWVHLFGGRIDIEPLKVRDAQTRLHQFFGGAVASIDAVELQGRDGALEAAIAVTGAEGVERAALTWELRPAGRPDQPPAYTGAGRLLTFPQTDRRISAQLSEPLALAAGAYDLWLTVDSGVAGSQPQRAVVRGAVSQRTTPPYVRSVAAAGPFHLSLAEAPTELTAGAPNTLRFAVSGDGGGMACRVAWRLLLPGGQEAARGEGGACDEAVLLLPEALADGRYTLEVKASAVLAGASSVSDAISLPVEVAR